MNKPIANLFIDMDGTTARFYSNPRCLEAMYEKGYFASLDAYEEMTEAIRRIIREEPRIRCIFLSACPIENPAAEPEKIDWLRKVFGEQVWFSTGTTRYDILMCKRNVNKAKFAEEFLGRKMLPTDFLLDDYTRNLREWEERGGSGIKCINEIQDTPDANSYAGPRIHADENSEFIYNTLTTLILKGQTKPSHGMTLSMEINVGDHSVPCTVTTQGPIVIKDGSLMLPNDGTLLNHSIPLSDITSANITVVEL